MVAPAEFLTYIDENAEGFIQRLKEAVAIPSVSSEGAHRDDVIAMGAWLNKQLTGYGVDTTLVDVGKQVLDKKEIPLPNVILGKLGNDPSKKTVLIYGHFDVQPAKIADGWKTDPFKLTVGQNGELFGRGSTDDKGPVLGWLNVLQYHHEKKKELPVNVRFCFEGMEESGSKGLEELVARESKPGGYFEGVDCVCISDNYWLNSRTPAVTYGLRGIVYWGITVSGPAKDLHSGIFGRTVHEPMTDLVRLMDKLVETNGKIIIPTLDDVHAAGEEERKMYEGLDYCISDLDEEVGASISLTDDRVEMLMARMRLPSLSLHGISGAYSGTGSVTVIPAKVTGRFSVRLVPPQTPDTVNPLITAYIKEEFKKLNTKNKLELEYFGDGKPWLADYKDWNFEAAKAATLAVYGKKPDLTREGGSIPVTLTFAEALGVSVCLLPMGRGNDGAHSINEKIDRSNFIQGSKLLGSYLYEIAAATM